jgi:hypothetical protein
MLDVVQISKFTYSLLGVLGFICLLIGSSLYQASGLAQKEFRTLIIYDILISLACAPINLLFVFRLNAQYGMPDMFVILFDDVVASVFS